MRFRLVGLIVLTLSVLISLVSSLQAQNTASGSLTGVVSDPSDHVVPGANVELTDSHKGTLRETKTDSEGTYLFSFLLPGSYTVRVSRAGFTTAIVPVNVLLGPPGTLNIKIAIAPVATTLTVSLRNV